MRIENVPFAVTHWGGVAATEHPGEAGSFRSRAVEAGNLRVRMVEYSPGYLADHWCNRGHVLLVLEGELVMELSNGERHAMGPGTSFQVQDDAEHPHRVYTEGGARVFIVD